jgi:hypothetical protein
MAPSDKQAGRRWFFAASVHGAGETAPAIAIRATASHLIRKIAKLEARPMAKLTPEGEKIVATLAEQYKIGADAVKMMLDAVVKGGGAMAQFNVPEFGGSGQWMRGGMMTAAVEPAGKPGGHFRAGGARVSKPRRGPCR